MCNICPMFQYNSILLLYYYDFQQKSSDLIVQGLYPILMEFHVKSYSPYIAAFFQLVYAGIYAPEQSFFRLCRFLTVSIIFLLN